MILILINLLRFISCPCFHVLHNALANFRHTNHPHCAPAVCRAPTFDKYFVNILRTHFSLCLSRDSITQHYTISQPRHNCHSWHVPLSPVSRVMVISAHASAAWSHITLFTEFSLSEDANSKTFCPARSFQGWIIQLLQQLNIISKEKFSILVAGTIVILIWSFMCLSLIVSAPASLCLALYRFEIFVIN